VKTKTRSTRLRGGEESLHRRGRRWELQFHRVRCRLGRAARPQSSFRGLQRAANRAGSRPVPLERIECGSGRSVPDSLRREDDAPRYRGQPSARLPASRRHGRRPRREDAIQRRLRRRLIGVGAPSSLAQTRFVRTRHLRVGAASPRFPLPPAFRRASTGTPGNERRNVTATSRRRNTARNLECPAAA